MRWRLHTLMLVTLYALTLTLLVRLIYSYGIAAENQTSNVHPFASELCQYLELADTGQEGEAGGKYTLRSVSIVFRHGERSALITDEDVVNCAPFREIDRRNFETLRTLIDSRAFNEFLTVDKGFARFDRYPHRSKCSSGNLTAEGALQHSRLGNHMRSAYSKTGLFKRALNVSVVSSPYRRTFQSAVAFISAFLFPERLQVPRVHISLSEHTYLCVDEWCACPPAKDFRLQYEQEHLAYFLSRSPASLRHKAQRIFKNISLTSNAPDPFQMLDVMLGRYLCRREPLPCAFNGECVTLGLLQQLLNETSERGRVMYEEGRAKSIASRLITAEALPILTYVAHKKNLLFKNPNVNYINIYSGHDVTVGPILRALHLPFVDFPRYASHISFEIYEDDTRHFYLRVLYNGVDVTSQLSFCHALDLCPMEVFVLYVDHLLPSAGFQSSKDLCDSSIVNVTQRT